LPIAFVTNAVVANCVVFVPGMAVGANGVPVNPGEAIGAKYEPWFPSSKSASNPELEPSLFESQTV
jgi:ABC-type cobalt transport system substrate-binding protein